MKKLLSILLLFPVLAFAQIPDMSRITLPTNGPALGVSSQTVTGVNGVAGTAGTPINVTITFANLTGNVTVTPFSPVEVSIDAGSTWSTSAVLFSTGSPITLKIRTTSSASAGAVSGTINITAAGVSAVPLTVTGTVSPTPTLTVTPTSLLNFTSNAGSLGGAQTYGLVGSGLGASVLATAPSGYKVSQDGTTFAGTQTVTLSSGAVNKTMYVALSDANTAASYSGNVTNVSGAVSASTIALTGTTSSGATFATLTIDHTKVLNTDQTNFTVTWNVTNVLLKSTGNGGPVTSVNNMIFSASNTFGTLLNWNVVYWNPATGQLIADIKIPTLSHTADNVFYFKYGALGYSSFQGGSAGAAYDASTTAVYNFPDGTTLSAADASSNGFNGTITGVTATAGLFGGAAHFSGTTQYISLGNVNPPGVGDFTVESLLYPASFGGFNGILSKTAGGAPKPLDYRLDATTGKPILFVGNGSGNTSISGTTAPTLNAWNYVAVTFTQSTSTIAHYLNGNTNGSSVGAGYPGSASGTENTYIGTRSDFVTMFNGNMNRVKVSSVPRSTDWEKDTDTNWRNSTTYISSSF